MKIFIHPTYDDMSRAVADFITDYIRQKPAALLCFPSGDTPTSILQYLVQYAQAGVVNFEQCSFVGLDEWVGMDQHDEGSCQHYLYTQFLNPAGIKPNQIQIFNARAENVAEECACINEYIARHGPLDIMLVGLGMNGHIGLNEPGVDFAQYAHCQELDAVTKTVGQKYFKNPTHLHAGLTLGLQHLREAHVPILIAAGAKKADIVARALQGTVTNQVPASIVQTHPNASVFLDQAAAAALHLPAAT